MREDHTGYYVGVNIGSEKLDMLVDTGANVTLIPVRAYNALAPEARPPLTPVRGWVKYGNGRKEPATGKAVFKMQFPQFSVDQLIWVADVDGDGMIGKDFMKGHGCTVDMRDATLHLNPGVTIGDSGPSDFGCLTPSRTCRYVVTTKEDGPRSAGCVSTGHTGEIGATHHGQGMPSGEVALPEQGPSAGCASTGHNCESRAARPGCVSPQVGGLNERVERDGATHNGELEATRPGCVLLGDKVDPGEHCEPHEGSPNERARCDGTAPNGDLGANHQGPEVSHSQAGDFDFDFDFDGEGQEYPLLGPSGPSGDRPPQEGRVARFSQIERDNYGHGCSSWGR